jgi:hypothetical protein
VSATRWKGDAGAVGAHEVYDLCARLEDLGRADTVVGASPLLDALAAACERARTALVAH